MYNLADKNELELFANRVAIGTDSIAQMDFMRLFDDERIFSAIQRIKAINGLLVKLYEHLHEDITGGSKTLVDFGLNNPILTDNEQILHDALLAELVRNFDNEEMPREVKSEIVYLNQNL